MGGVLRAAEGRVKGSSTSIALTHAVPAHKDLSIRQVENETGGAAPRARGAAHTSPVVIVAVAAVASVATLRLEH